jgi:hypothetical protein
LNLGDEVTVRVDDIDNSGKLSLSLAGDEPAAAEGGAEGGESGGREERAPRAAREPREPREPSAPSAASNGDVEVASFDDDWDNKAREEFGDLGPADAARSDRGGDRGGERRGGTGGGGRGGRRGGGGGGGGGRR